MSHPTPLSQAASPILLQNSATAQLSEKDASTSDNASGVDLSSSNGDRLSPSTELGSATSLRRVIPRPPLRPINPQPLSPYGERPDTSETKNILSLEVRTISRSSVSPSASPPWLGPHSHGLPRRALGDASAASVPQKLTACSPASDHPLYIPNTERRIALILASASEHHVATRRAAHVHIPHTQHHTTDWSSLQQRWLNTASR